jgi:hypothetical protein
MTMTAPAGGGRNRAATVGAGVPGRRIRMYEVQLVRAGLAPTDDPRFTVEPQRARLDRSPAVMAGGQPSSCWTRPTEPS